MKRKLFITLIVCVLGSPAAFCQQKEILASLVADGKINTRLPLADSMPSVANRNWAKDKKDLELQACDISELKKLSRKSHGMHLESAPVQTMTLIKAAPYFRGLQTGDSACLAYIEKNKPFYVLSSPLLFKDGKEAIVEVNLVGSGGYTYLLRLEAGKWIIIKEIVRWVV